jgi:hypothetical protein
MLLGAPQSDAERHATHTPRPEVVSQIGALLGQSLLAMQAA